MKLVCITGIDGGGKSTLAKGIVSVLVSEGSHAHYLYGRIVPVISLILMKLGRFLFLRGKNPWSDFSGYSNNKRKIMRNPALKFVYTSAIYLDFYFQIWFKLLPLYVGSKIVILDRYIYDTVISDLAAHLGYSKEFTEKSIRRANRFIPKPQLTILIDLPEDVACSRKTDVPHIDYLRERRDYFLALRKSLNLECLDGEMPKEELIDKSLILIRNVI